MSERDSGGLRRDRERERERPLSTNSSSSSFFCCLHIVLDSIKIISRNKQIFFSIFALLALPLSLHLFSVSFVSLPLKSHIHHLEAVGFYSSRFEAGHIWKESRENAISLLRLKAIFSLPSFIVSLLVALSSVNSTAAGVRNQRPNFHSNLPAIRLTWHRPVVTAICVYAVSLLYFNVPRAFVVVIGGQNHLLRFLIWWIFSGLDVYLMAVMGMGLVVSITEERLGFDAIRVGSHGGEEAVRVDAVGFDGVDIGFYRVENGEKSDNGYERSRSGELVDGSEGGGGRVGEIRVGLFVWVCGGLELCGCYCVLL